jgi:hypothetical protein
MGVWSLSDTTSLRFFLKTLLRSVVFALSLALAHAALAQPVLPKAQSLDSNTVLFEISIDQHVLTDSLNAFQLGQKIFLPLGEMSSLMTIAIRAYPGEGAGRGFVRGESKTFSLNIGNRTVTLGDKTSTFDAADILRQDDDIYVESKLLADWLLVDFDVNLNSLFRCRHVLPANQSWADSPDGQDRKSWTIPEETIPTGSLIRHSLIRRSLSERKGATAFIQTTLPTQHIFVATSRVCRLLLFYLEPIKATPDKTASR